MSMSSIAVIRLAALACGMDDPSRACTCIRRNTDVNTACSTTILELSHLLQLISAAKQYKVLTYLLRCRAPIP